MNPDITGFYGFRVGFPQYNKSIFMNKVELVTDSYGRIIGVTNPDKLLWADVPSTDGEIQIIEVGERAFENASRLRKITFSDNLEIIGEEAFKGCRNLSSISLPQTLYQIGPGAFEKSAIKSFVFPPLVEEVPPRLFMDDEDLESVVLHPGIKKLGVMSFAGCRKLRSIDLPERIKEIPDGAFMYSAISSIYLPHSLRRIGTSALSGMKYLSAIYYDGGEDDFRRISYGRNWNRGINNNCVLYLKDREGLWYNAFDGKRKEKKTEDRTELKDALALFGLTEIPTKGELNKIFHSKAMAFHPDKISSKGLDEEFMHFAEEKFRSYKEAFDLINRYIN